MIWHRDVVLIRPFFVLWLNQTMVAITDLLASAWLLPLAYGASSSSSAASSQYTIPASTVVGANQIANIDDPEAVNTQSACPGYKASNVHQTSKGFTATLNLAGEPCNVYGMDVDPLDLSVEYQAADRLDIHCSDSCRCVEYFVVFPQ